MTIARGERNCSQLRTLNLSIFYEISNMHVMNGATRCADVDDARKTGESLAEHPLNSFAVSVCVQFS